MIYTIPLQPYPNQRTTVTVNNQNVTVAVYIIQDGGMYADVYIDADLIIAGARCNAGITLNQYLTPLKGYLTWWTADNAPPTWKQIGSTAFLLWSDYSIEDVLFDKYVVANLEALTNEFG